MSIVPHISVFLKTNKLLIHTARQRNLKIIMLTEKKEDTKGHTILFIYYSGIGNTGHRNHISGCCGEVEGAAC